MDNTIKTYHYTIQSMKGVRIGQVVLTSTGMFSAVSEYGNFACSFPAFLDGKSKEDIRYYLTYIDTYALSNTIGEGMGYLINQVTNPKEINVFGRRVYQTCQAFAEEILPRLQDMLRRELKEENPELYQWI